MVKFAELSAKKPTKEAVISLIQPVLSSESIKYCDHAELSHGMFDDDWSSLRLFSWNDMVKPVIKKTKPKQNSVPKPVATSTPAHEPLHEPENQLVMDVPMLSQEDSEDEPVMDYKQANKLMMRGIIISPFSSIINI